MSSDVPNLPWMPSLGEAGFAITAEEKVKLSKLQSTKSMPLPANEALRIQVIGEAFALERCNDVTMKRYARLVNSAMKKFFIGCLSIVGVDKTWIISGSNTSFFKIIGIDRTESFCAYTIHEDTEDVMIVNDATVDHRFWKLPWVHNIMSSHFCAAASLKVSGVKIGSVAALDTKARYDFTEEDADKLRCLSDIIGSVLSARRNRYLALVNERERLCTLVADILRGPVLKLKQRAIELQALMQKAISEDQPSMKVLLMEKVQAWSNEVKELESQITIALQSAHGGDIDQHVAEMSEFHSTFALNTKMKAMEEI